MNTSDNFQVPAGFEVAHEEWLALGGKKFLCLPGKLTPAHEESLAARGQRYITHSDYYKMRYWALVRQAVLARDSSTCFRCRGPASYVHHLSYTFRGEDHLHPETLVSICGPCHQIVEYARLAESLLTKIHRRISLCSGYLKDEPGCLDQDAAHVAARLLGYQDTLAELEKLFATNTLFKKHRGKSVTETEATSEQCREVGDSYEKQALDLVSVWQGSEKEKAERLIPMLEMEIPKVERFIAKVLEPILPSAERLGKNQYGQPVTKTKSNVAGVEALVVGIKFHRGHTNGIVSGESVDLVREPNNAYDPNAIRVNLQNGETLGYLTKEFAAVFAKQLDSGGDIQAHVSKIVREKVYVAVSPRQP